MPAIAAARLPWLAQSLGPGYDVRMLQAEGHGGAQPLDVAVQLPDGAMLTARLPLHPEPPLLGSPLLLTILFVLVSMTLLGFWATRALRTPLSGFAEAAEEFSLDGNVAALPERGPQEIRAVAKAFNRMRDRIRKLVDDRMRLLASMGHDLRTPITRLRLRSEFIRERRCAARCCAISIR